jgi:hypothetical protein
VIGASGMLTGYGGGLGVKEKLLHLEGARFRLPRPATGESVTGRKKRTGDPGPQASFEY